MRRGKHRAARIHAGHLIRAAARGIHGTRSGVGKAVQHPTMPAQRLHPGAVIALIQEEPGLLPSQHIRLKLQAVLQKADRAARRRAGEDRAVGQASERLAGRLHRPAQAKHYAPALHRPLDRLQEHRHMRHPGAGVELEHQRLVIAIQHQPRQSVILAVHQPIPRRDRGARQRLAPADRLRHSLPEPPDIDGNRPVALEDAHPDRRGGIVESQRQKAVAPVVEDREGPGTFLTVELGDP